MLIVSFEFHRQRTLGSRPLALWWLYRTRCSYAVLRPLRNSNLISWFVMRDTGWKMPTSKQHHSWEALGAREGYCWRVPHYRMIYRLGVLKNLHELTAENMACQMFNKGNCYCVILLIESFFYITGTVCTGRICQPRDAGILSVLSACLWGTHSGFTAAPGYRRGASAWLVVVTLQQLPSAKRV